MATAGSHQSCARWGSEGEDGHWRTAAARTAGHHLPALLWGLCCPPHTPGPPCAEQVRGAQCSRVLPVPFLHQISLEQGCRLWSAPLRALSCMQLHPLWEPLLAASLQQGRHTAKQTQREGRNPEFGISPIPATQPPASSAPARDELQPPLLNPTAKTKQAVVSLRGQRRGQRQGQDSPHVPSKHSQMEEQPSIPCRPDGTGAAGSPPALP